MIQRVQSIFLFFVALAMVTMLFFPLWQKVDLNAAEIATMNAFKLTVEQFEEESDARTLMLEQNVFYISIPAILAAAIALFSIFQYRNRLRQIQLGALNSIVIGASLGLMVYYILKAENLLATEMQGNYLMGFYLPIAALLFNLLANRFIRRDEALVRSANRIR